MSVTTKIILYHHNRVVIFIRPGSVPPSTLIATPSGDGHDYETQDNWDESPPHEYYSHYTSDDKVGSSDDDDDEEEDPDYEPVRYSIVHDFVLY